MVCRLGDPGRVLEAEVSARGSEAVPIREGVMKRLVLFLSILLYAHAALAGAPFEFTAPSLRLPDDPNVDGVRLSLFHGRNQGVRGFDLGLLSLSEASTFSGLSLVAGVHRVTGGMSGGAAFSLVNYHTGHDSGMNGAFINKLNNTENAFNVSFLNIADGTTQVDLGGLNMSNRSLVQLGFLNITNEIRSFQFGFLNVAKNGFLPVFPVINFPKPKH
jgi:hypothetical protein